MEHTPYRFKRKAYEAFVGEDSQPERPEEQLKEEPFCDDEGDTQSPSASDDEGWDFDDDDDFEDHYDPDIHFTGRGGGGGKKRKGKQNRLFTSKHVRQQMSRIR